MKRPENMTRAELDALPEGRGARMDIGLADNADTITNFRDTAGNVWEVAPDGERWVKELRYKAPEPVTRQQPIRWAGRPDVHEIARYLNQLKPGQSLILDNFVLGATPHNWMLYGDLWAALRGNLMGSAYGTFRRRVGSEGWLITVHEAGERIYDRDGHPLQGISDPTTDLF